MVGRHASGRHEDYVKFLQRSSRPGQTDSGRTGSCREQTKFVPVRLEFRCSTFPRQRKLAYTRQNNSIILETICHLTVLLPVALRESRLGVLLLVATSLAMSYNIRMAAGLAAEVIDREETLVAEARYVPNRQFLSIPLRSELIHTV